MKSKPKAYLAPAHVDVGHEIDRLNDLIAKGIDVCVDGIAACVADEGMAIPSHFQGYIDVLLRLARECQFTADRLYEMERINLGEASGTAPDPLQAARDAIAARWPAPADGGAK